MNITRLRLWILLAALVLAGLLSLLASSSPDGLERVAIDQHFAQAARPTAVAPSWLSDYQMQGIGNKPLARSAAGLVGVLVVLLLTQLWSRWLLRHAHKTSASNPGHTDSHAAGR